MKGPYEGMRFEHRSWVRDIKTMAPAVCVVTDVADNIISYQSEGRDDPRQVRCGIEAFWSGVGRRI